MKKYYIIVLVGHTHWEEIVEANYFNSTTNSSASAGFYSFYVGSELIACYPIDRTIISKIESV